MKKNYTKHNRDFDFEDQVLHEIAELYNGGKLSPRDKLILEAATHSKRQMNLLHFADAEELVEWTTYCHLVEMDEFWHNEDREAWRNVFKLLWEKFVRLVRSDYTPWENGNKRAVIQYDLDGNLVKRWPSGRRASLELGISASNISACCHGKITHCGPWRFRLADEGKEAADA